MKKMKGFFGNHGFCSKFYENGELKDHEILNALKNAVDQYENGEIIEVRDLLCDIVEAINEFDKNYHS